MIRNDTLLNKMQNIIRRIFHTRHRCHVFTRSCVETRNCISFYISTETYGTYIHMYQIGQITALSSDSCVDSTSIVTQRLHEFEWCTRTRIYICPPFSIKIFVVYSLLAKSRNPARNFKNGLSEKTDVKSFGEEET